jgi:glycosyltransferase involved in cell wall biosynthesis
MMGIIISCKTLLKGGAEKQALILSKLLTEKKIDVILLNWNKDKIDPEYLKYIEEHSIRYFTFEGNLIAKFFHFQKILRDEKISVVISYLTLANFLSGLTKIFTREVITIGGIRNEKLPYYKFFFEKLIHNYLNDATIFNNYSAVEKFVKRGYKSGKIFVIHNAIEYAQKTIHTKKLNTGLRIITVSRFVGQKDFRTALFSFKNLIDRNKDIDISYYIVGFGPLEREIRTLAENLNITDRIKILINPSNIPDILKECDIYLSTSLFEGLSNSLMEAMVFGLPIVATDVGDNRYLIKDSFNGYLTGCKDINLITEKLDKLIGSEELRKRFGEFSQEKIKNDFSQDSMLTSYLTLLSKFQNF